MDDLEARYREDQSTFDKFEADRVALERADQEKAYNKAKGAFERATADMKKPLKALADAEAAVVKLNEEIARANA